MFETILLPTDGSEPADRAVARGFDLATAHDATLRIVHVIEESDAGVAVREYDERIQTELEDTGRELVDDLVARADDRGLAATGEVRHGNAHEEILAAADEHNVDLIVMGTHGRTGIEGLLLGSVAERVVRLAPVSVLVARPDRE